VKKVDQKKRKAFPGERQRRGKVVTREGGPWSRVTGGKERGNRQGKGTTGGWTEEGRGKRNREGRRHPARGRRGREGGSKRRRGRVRGRKRRGNKRGGERGGGEGKAEESKGRKAGGKTGEVRKDGKGGTDR